MPPDRRNAARFPDRPGVYIFRNSDGELIYVGKGKSLSRRLRSYFCKAGRDDLKVSHLLVSARSIETIVTNTEGEALNLENRLIKQTRPRYNVLLRDDKTYPYIKLTVTGQGAQVAVTRRRDADGGIYAGPFFPASLAHQVARLIRRYFLAPNQAPAAMGYAMRRPSQLAKQRPRARTTGAHRRETERIGRVHSLLEGHISGAVTSFSRRMIQASNARRFEEAARYKRYLGVLKQLRKQVNAASIPDGDTDVLGFCSIGPLTAFTVFQFRRGEIATRRDAIGQCFPGAGCDELLLSLAHSLYSEASAPPEIVALMSERQREIFEQALTSDGRRDVRIRNYVRGPLRAWEDIADKNAQVSLEEWIHGSRPRGSRVTPRNEARFGSDEVYPRAWQSAGRSGNRGRTHGKDSQAARLSSQQWRRFAAVRCSSYACPRRSGFTPHLPARDIFSSDLPSPRESATVRCQQSPTEFTGVTIELQGRSAMTGEAETERLRSPGTV